MKTNNKLLFLMSLLGIVLSSCSVGGESKDQPPYKAEIFI